MEVIEKKRPETVQSMFGAIAKNYDRGNAVLSFQMHRLWNRALIKEVFQRANPSVILDLCAGTGAITYGYLERTHHHVDAYLLDFCAEMLQVAREREGDFPKHNLEYLQADAQHIPLPDNMVDAATIAYGIRNVKEPMQCIADTYRVLKEGGRFGVLELTRPTNGLLRVGHKFYLQNVLPRIGKWLLNNEAAYQYLCNSIEHFVEPKEIQHLMEEAGFCDVKIKPLLGGVATIISGVKR